MLRAHGNEDSTLVSGYLAPGVSTDRAWGIVDIQLHRSLAAYYHWIHSSRVRNRRTRDGSEIEVVVQAAPRSFVWTGIASRNSDYPRIHYFEHRQPSCRMGPPARCYGNLWYGDCRNLHVNET